MAAKPMTARSAAKPAAAPKQVAAKSAGGKAAAPTTTADSTATIDLTVRFDTTLERVKQRNKELAAGLKAMLAEIK